MLVVFEINTLRIILNLLKLNRAYNMERIVFLIFLGAFYTLFCMQYSDGGGLTLLLA